MSKITIVEYVGEDGKSPFARWFSRIDATAAAKVSTALYRIEQGNVSNIKSVGKGIFECKIDFGPGYRIYFGWQSDTLVILLGGGAKKTQDRDIKLAYQHWLRYKSSRR